MSQLPLIILSIALAAGPLNEDQPMVPPPHNGEIGGIITSATPLDSIKAVVRDSGKTFTAGSEMELKTAHIRGIDAPEGATQPVTSR